MQWSANELFTNDCFLKCSQTQHSNLPSCCSVGFLQLATFQCSFIEETARIWGADPRRWAKAKTGAEKSGHNHEVWWVLFQKLHSVLECLLQSQSNDLTSQIFCTITRFCISFQIGSGCIVLKSNIIILLVLVSSRETCDPHCLLYNYIQTYFLTTRVLPFI